MTEPSVQDICAVIVSYRPELATIKSLIDAVVPQVGAIALVDNASPGGWQLELGDALSSQGGALLSQSSNLGLAEAQNAGIAWARSKGYRYVLLLDQDSEPGSDMVAALLQALTSMNRPAAVGPRFHDVREDRDAPFVRVGFPFNRKLWCTEGAEPIACDFLISSGALIPLSVIDEVGAMDAGLFIDNVDLEWGFRARARGYTLYGVCTAMMYHRLGDARHALPFGSGQVVVHGPLRLYFMMRNRLLLYRMAHTPRAWIAQDVPRVLGKLFLFGVLIGPRSRNLRCMLRGLWDGLLGRRGGYPAEPSGGV